MRPKGGRTKRPGTCPICFTYVGARARAWHLGQWDRGDPVCSPVRCHAKGCGGEFHPDWFYDESLWRLAFSATPPDLGETRFIKIGYTSDTRKAKVWFYCSTDCWLQYHLKIRCWKCHGENDSRWEMDRRSMHGRPPRRDGVGEDSGGRAAWCLACRGMYHGLMTELEKGRQDDRALRKPDQAREIAASQRHGREVKQMKGRR